MSERIDTSSILEATQLDIGYVPLSDCAPLVVAYEKGFFEAEGLQVTLHRERSWASIRDKTAFGVYDASQMLYPMPLASTLGVGGPAVPMVTSLCLSLGGNAITVSNELHDEMVEADPEAAAKPETSAEALAAVIRKRQAEDGPTVTFGCVFPTSTHYYELRFWLESAGIDCDLDVQIIVVPPPDMPEALREKKLDGFCVGEPWNSFTVQRGWGRVVITKQSLWNNGPEKVLGVTRQWADKHPATHRAMVRAVIEAAAWCDQPENRAEVAGLIADERYLDVPVDIVELSMLGGLRFVQAGPVQTMPDFMIFHRYAANFPWRSHALWFLERMIAAGQIDPPVNEDAVVSSVMRLEVYREACKQLELPYPLTDYKVEGTHDQPWTLEAATQPIEMGPDCFIDRRVFTAPLSTTRANGSK